MEESGQGTTPEKVSNESPVARFLNTTADNLDGWAGREATKEDIANAAALTTVGVMGIGLAMKYGPSAAHEVEQIVDFAAASFDYIAAGVKDARDVHELVGGLLARTTQVTSGVALETCLRAGEEIIGTMTSNEVENTANLGVELLIGATSISTGIGLEAAVKLREKGEKHKPLQMSTHLVPAIAGSLRMLARISQRDKS